MSYSPVTDVRSILGRHCVLCVGCGHLTLDFSARIVQPHMVAYANTTRMAGGHRDSNHTGRHPRLEKGAHLARWRWRRVEARRRPSSSKPAELVIAELGAGPLMKWLGVRDDFRNWLIRASVTILAVHSGPVRISAIRCFSQKPSGTRTRAFAS